VAVVTVSMVAATPPFGVTAGGLKLHVIPARTGQEKVTGSANPPVGVTVMLNMADCPAVTVAAGGVVLTEKSLSAIVVVTAAEVLPPKFPSPAKDAVSECAPAARVLMVIVATPAAFSGTVPKLAFPS